MRKLRRSRFKTVLIMCIITFLIGMFSVLGMTQSAVAEPEVSEAAFDVTSGDETESYDLSDPESAQGYVDNYAGNLESDPDFETHVEGAIAKVREEVSLFATFWALLPPIIAIVLALITKEVYSSLIIGVIVGGFLWAGGNFEKAITHIVCDGFVANIADGYNVGILVFLVLLGVLVIMMNRAGGSAAFGRWAKTHIKTRKGAQLATMVLGLLIFIDDYFNCLTVGSVMRPVTDGHKVSRAKLAYLIDATAAPVCIIAPISSWAAAVAGFAESAGATNGIELFIQAIPYNFYALLTIAMMIFLIVTDTDYGPMQIHEENAKEKDDLFTSGAFQAVEEETDVNPKGKMIDLLFPIIVLIICCIIGMIYSGGFFEGADFITAFSNCDAAVGLSLGAFCAIIITVIYMLIRRAMPFRKMMEAIPDGFKAMVPAILILVCAWTLKSMTDSLGAKIFVSQIVESGAVGFQNFLPAIIFAIAVGLSFATGTSWGTFGILIPIVLSVFPAGNPITILAISACMAGAVCGDHCSPISDTTIMSSAGAQCDHLNHVSTQLPYALTVAAVSGGAYIVAGFINNWMIALPIALAMMLVVLFIIRFKVGKRKKAAAA